MRALFTRLGRLVEARPGSILVATVVLVGLALIGVTQTRIVTSQEVFERVLLKLIPYKRIGEPEDVARATVWLASDESDYVNGTTIYIDGAMTCWPGFIGAG